MKIVLKPLAKSVLLSASAADTGLQKKNLRVGLSTASHNIDNFKRRNVRYYENS